MRYVPKAQRPGRPESTLTRVRRLSAMEAARPRVGEMPFDPEAPREHYAKPHHFALNGGRRRFKVVKPERDYRTGELTGSPTDTLISSRAHGFMSLQEARRWADDNDVGPFAIVEYVAGCESDPRLGSRLEPNARFRAAPASLEAATELVLFIENTSHLSPMGPSGQGRSVLLNALRKWRSGDYDPERAATLFGYLAEAGAREYTREFGGDWKTMFTPATRRLAAAELEESFRTQAANGEFDHL